MLLGLGLPSLGSFADPVSVSTVAAEAESLGFDSLYAGERVHAPSEPQNPYPGGDGTMPEEMRASLDPIVALTLAATATSRVRLGTSTLSAPLRSPLQLARGLTGVDLASDGRLNVGLGLSWLSDEFDAVAVPWNERGARLDETIDVLEALWSPDPIKHDGRFWNISEGQFQPKPKQDKPPLYLGGFTPAAFRRIGRRADGWLGVALPPDMLRRTIDTIRTYAEEAGRGPVRTVLRVNPKLADEPGGPTTGPIEHICSYLHEVADLGVEESFVDLQFTTREVPELLDAAARIRAEFPS